MERVAFAGWTFLCDPGATRTAYASIQQCQPESCGCAYCRNWIAARAAVYPEPIRGFLTGVGVDEPCEAEVIQHVVRESGLHLCEGWLHFVGRIEEGPEHGTTVDVANASVGFEARSDLAHDALRGSELVQMTIQAEVPWLLDEPWDVNPADA
jgi:hypothetical protein